MRLRLTQLLEIERNEMPQVRGKDIPALLKTLKDNGIAYRKGSMAVNMLRPVQDDGSPSKIDAIASDLTSVKTFPPIVVSKNGYILDGHHRWLAYKKVFGDNYSMRVIMIMLPKFDALKLFSLASDEVK